MEPKQQESAVNIVETKHIKQGLLGMWPLYPGLDHQYKIVFILSISGNLDVSNIHGLVPW